MKALLLVEEALARRVNTGALSHQVTFAPDAAACAEALGSGRYFAVLVERERVDEALCDALCARPRHIALYLISRSVDFDLLDWARRMRVERVLRADALEERPTEGVNECVESACDRFYESLFSLLHQALHSTEPELNRRLALRLSTWYNAPVSVGVLKAQGAEAALPSRVAQALQPREELALMMEATGEVLFLSPNASEDSLRAMLGALEREVPGAELAVGVSTPLAPGETLKDKLRQARLAVQVNFYEERRVSTYHREAFREKDDFVRLIALEKQLSNAILSCLELGEVRRITGQYFDYFRQVRLLPQMVYDDLFRFLNSLDRVFKYIDPLCTIHIELIRMEDIAGFATIDALQQEAERLFCSFVTSADRYRRPAALEVSCVRHYLETHLSEDISLEDIAREFYLDKFTLCKLFKQQTGESLWDCFTRLRMEQAARLLTGTDRKIYEIARSVGYADSAYFSTAFKSAKGVSPREYRARGNVTSR